MLGMRQIQTPNGMVLVPEDQAAGFGLAPLPVPESPVPEAAIANTGLPESPVPAVAAPVVAPVATGLAQVDAPPQPEPTKIAPPPELAPPAASPVASAPPQESAAQSEPAARREPAKSLSQATFDDLARKQDEATQAQIAANQKAGEAQAAQDEAVGNAMAERDRIAGEKIAAMDQARAADEAALKQKESVWQAKNDEWMKAKVTRRGMSTGEMVMAAIAGFGSALKGQGDQNPALGVIMSNIQRDVDDQIRERDELGKQSSALKGSLDYAREVASNAQAQRVAAYGLEMQRQGQMLETVAKRMEPGIKRANMEATSAELKAGGVQQYGQALQMQHAEDAQKAAREQAERESRRSAAMAGARIREDARQFDATDKRIRDLATLDYQKEIGKAIAAGDVEKAKLLTAQQKEERELAIGGGAAMEGGPAPTAAIKAMNDLNRSLGIEKRVDMPGFNEKGLMLSRDGSVWKAPDLVSAQGIRKQVSATISASNMIDEILRLRDAHGWSSDLLKSPEWRKMQSNKGAIIVQMKNAAELGALSGPDMELIESMLGTKDVTEFRDPSDGLRQAKTKMQESTRNVLTTAGYDGDAFSIPDASREEKAAADSDQVALGSKANYDRNSFTLGGVTSGAAPKMNREGEIALQNLVTRANVLRDGKGEINPDARRAVDALRKEAQSANNPAARQAAAQALVGLAIDGNPFVPPLDEIKGYLRPGGPKGKR